jgi:hypothetical protein
MKPISKKAEVQKRLDSVEKQNNILLVCLNELVKSPEKIQWVTCGSGATMVSWGLIRPTAIFGGYIIRCQGIDPKAGLYAYTVKGSFIPWVVKVNAAILDDYCNVVNARLANSELLSDALQYPIIMNEREVMHAILKLQHEAMNPSRPSQCKCGLDWGHSRACLPAKVEG